MPQPSKIPLAFAASGDKNVIPESTETTGLASWRDGFPAITSAPFSEGGVAPKRADFNGIFYALSQAVMWLQQGGVYAYDASTNYEIGNITEKSGIIYICKTANGPSSAVKDPATDTAETYWGKVYPQNGTFSRMFFSQTSGSYTAPRTGVFRITIKGGGGGGGGGSLSSYYTGGSGGEGATLVFYETLIKNQSYSYTIGAGGAAGTTDNSSPTGGGDGGASSFNGQYSVNGGGGGNAAIGSGLRAGGGGGSYSAPGASTVFFIPGVGGQPAFRSAGSTWLSGQTVGGGAGGAQAGIAGNYGGGGGGGGGAGSAKNPSAGGTGYILIEYAG